MADNTLATIHVYPEVGGFPLLQEFSLTGGAMVQLPAAASASDAEVPIYVQVTIDQRDTDPLSDYSVEYSITPVSGSPSVQLVQNRQGVPVAGHDRISNSDIAAYYSDCVLVGETTGTQTFKITAQLKKQGTNVGTPLSTTAVYGAKIYSTSMAPTSGILKKPWDGTSNPPPDDQVVKYLYEVTQASNYNQKIQCQTYLQVLSPTNLADANPPTLPIVYADTTSAQLARVPLALFSQANDVTFLGQDGTDLTTQDMGVVYMAETDAASGHVTYAIASGYANTSVWMTANCGVASENFSSNNLGSPDFLFMKLPSVGAGGTLGQLYLSSNEIDFSNYLDNFVYAQDPTIPGSDLINRGIIMVQTTSGDIGLAYGPTAMEEFQRGVSVPLTALLGNENYLRLVERATTEGTSFKYSYASLLTTVGAYSPKPLRGVNRTYPAPQIPVSGYIDWYAVRNGLDITATFGGLGLAAGDVITLTIYLNGYHPGTNDPKAILIQQEYHLQSATQTQHVFHFSQTDLINYAFSNDHQPGFFYADFIIQSKPGAYSKVLGDNDSIQLNTVPGDG